LAKTGAKAVIRQEKSMVTSTVQTSAKYEKPVSIEEMLIGKSPIMGTLRDMVRRVANSSASVMICGPSGCGKEVVARAIHNASPRTAKPYVALNCGAIPAELIESELFGHERGAFTGAQARRTGHFENADKGTLFLDEIGDMRFDMQVKLLRVLEDGLISRIGGNSNIPVDVRIISATHQKIDKAILDGRFREDLFFRLGVVVLQVPDLASRVEDIPQLIAHFQKVRTGQLCQFDDSAIQRLSMHDWPGNVRELRNVIERANILFSGETIDAFGVDQLLGRSLPKLAAVPALPVVVDALDLVPAAADAAPQPFGAPIDLKAQIERMELERIQMALIHAEGVISEAARLLTLKRTTLIEKMRKYRLEKIAA
jgi:sigma-54 specific flagellar transcriptional regulator A